MMMVTMTTTTTSGQMFLTRSCRELVLAGRGKQMLSKLTIATSKTSQQTEAREIAELRLTANGEA